MIRPVGIKLIGCAIFLMLASCQKPVLVKPLDEKDGAAAANQLYSQIKSAGIAQSKSNAAGGKAAFPGIDDTLNFLLQQLRSGDPEQQKSALKDISAELRRSSGYSTEVYICTACCGAQIKYRLISDEREFVLARLTNSSEPFPLTVGIYHVWAERNGKPTSKVDLQYSFMHASPQRIDVDEPGIVADKCGSCPPVPQCSKP